MIELFECVGIVGVGLIGASIGLALKQRSLCDHVLGIGRRRSSLESAKRIGAIDEFVVGIDEELSRVDFLVLCAPVDRIVDHALQASNHLDSKALITDVGSAKSLIVHQICERLPDGPAFVGSHPLAGSEKSGPEAASATLLDGRVCVVTPIDSTSPAALERVSDFWKALGMQVLERDPEEHDRILARTSHLPHLIASALASLMDEQDRPLAGTGLEDTIRIAAGDPALWTAIFQYNRDSILKSLADYQDRLDRFRSALELEEFATVREFFLDGKQRRDALGS